MGPSTRTGTLRSLCTLECWNQPKKVKLGQGTRIALFPGRRAPQKLLVFVGRLGTGLGLTAKTSSHAESLEWWENPVRRDGAGGTEMSTEIWRTPFCPWRARNLSIHLSADRIGETVQDRMKGALVSLESQNASMQSWAGSTRYRSVVFPLQARLHRRSRRWHKRSLIV